LVDLFKNGTSGKVRVVGLALLERTIYLELGAISGQESTISCVFCNGNIISKSILSPKAEYSAEELLHESDVQKKSDQCSSDGKSSVSVDMEKVDIEAEAVSKNCWECLELYRELVQSSDTKVSHTIISHLLKVIPRFIPSVKHRLLFKVFYPTFIAAKTCWFKSSVSNDNISNVKFKILSCLSAFSSILSGNALFVEEFVMQYNGLDHIMELISVPSFSKLCCSILEVTSIVEIWKLEFESGDTRNDVGKLPSLHMLQEAVQSATTRILSLLGIDSPVKYPQGTKTESCCYDSVENVLDSENTDELNEIMPVYEENKILHANLCLEVKEVSNMYDTVDRQNREGYVQLLSVVCIFWRTCANLVLCSPQYRQHLSQNRLARDGFVLLQVLLDGVTSKRQPGNFCYM
jgi:hypothetical protein